MQMQQASVLVPPIVLEPRGAEWAADAAIALGRAGRALWAAMEASGRQRAARRLLEIADGFRQTDPARARQLRAASRSLSGDVQRNGR